MSDTQTKLIVQLITDFQGTFTSNFLTLHELRLVYWFFSVPRFVLKLSAISAHPVFSTMHSLSLAKLTHIFDDRSIYQSSITKIIHTLEISSIQISNFTLLLISLSHYSLLNHL
jgi:hypothetical protein